jgi:hypothetical protein
MLLNVTLLCLLINNILFNTYKQLCWHMFPGDRDGTRTAFFLGRLDWHSGPPWVEPAAGRELCWPTLWSYSLNHAWTNKVVWTLYLQASLRRCAQKLFLRSQGKQSACFWCLCPSWAFLSEELHLVLSASWRVHSRCHPRHCGIDKRSHTEAVCSVYQILSSPHFLSQIFLIGRGSVLRWPS